MPEVHLASCDVETDETVFELISAPFIPIQMTLNWTSREVSDIEHSMQHAYNRVDSDKSVQLQGLLFTNLSEVLFSRKQFLLSLPPFSAMQNSSQEPQLFVMKE